MEELQERMSSAEFTQWVAYANEEPFGYPLDMWTHGVQSSSIVNAIHATIPVPKGGSRPKTLRPEDFHPQKKAAPIELTPEQREYLRKKRAVKSTKVKKRG